LQLTKVSARITLTVLPTRSRLAWMTAICQLDDGDPVLTRGGQILTDSL
jgi:hypothetical protein